MNKYWLSILVPSNRPEGLKNFIESLEKNTKKFDDIQIVVLMDDDRHYVEEFGNLVVIHHPPTEPLNMSQLNFECYKKATAPWIMLANDDIICDTYAWDQLVREICERDELNLIYPNDNMFGKALACFPIFSRTVIERVKLFPMPYLRYKQDDTIFEMYPPHRRIYLQDIKFTHLNDKGESGFTLPDGRIYPTDSKAGQIDQNTWMQQVEERKRIKIAYNSLLPRTNIPKVLIGVPTAEFARNAAFYDSYNLLEKPAGTISTSAHGQSPAKNRNLIIEQALLNDCTHILFLDDDIAFKPNMLNQLLSHNKDIVCGLQLMRNFPHQPIMFDKVKDDGSMFWRMLSDGDKGLVEIVGCGLGAVLITTDVFKKLDKPYIRLGELEADMWCDDVGFYNRCRAAGFKLYADLDCPIGHYASACIWPNNINGVWHTTYDTNGSGSVSVPQVKNADNRANQESKSAIA